MEHGSTVLNLAAAKSEKSDNGRLLDAGQDGDVAHPQESASALVPSPPIHKLGANRRERERLLPPGAGGPFGDAYKMLRTQVLKRLDQLNANTLAILSPSAGDGKTSTAINLAVAIAAERNRYVLLVDFDFRNPSLYRRLGLKTPVGVEDCLQSNHSIHTAMVKLAGYDRLTLLPARNRVENSSELLAEARTAEAVAEMRGRYVNRIVIFDLPPILASDDALVFSRLVQAGLIVVCEGRTKREDVTRSIGLLNELPIVGTALNASRELLGGAY
jgi:Mrp family chromosome partitioning ATPase